jgi:hypothetical protein
MKTQFRLSGEWIPNWALLLALLFSIKNHAPTIHTFCHYNNVFTSQFNNLFTRPRYNNQARSPPNIVQNQSSPVHNIEAYFLKIYLNAVVPLYSSGTQHGHVTYPSEHGNKHLCSTKAGNFLNIWATIYFSSWIIILRVSNYPLIFAMLTLEANSHTKYCWILEYEGVD